MQTQITGQERRKEYMKNRRQSQVYKERNRKYRQTSKWKEYHKKYKQTDDYKEKHKLLKQKEGRIESRRKYKHEYNSRPEIVLKKTSPQFKAKVIERCKKRIHHKLKTDKMFVLLFYLRKQLRSRLNSYSQNGKVKTSSEYGINYEIIIEYLIPKRKEKYHIDHIIPASRFDLNKEEEIKLCFSAENLQWLNAKENISKNNRIREKDILELKRRMSEESDKLDTTVLNQLVKKGERKHEQEI